MLTLVGHHPKVLSLQLQKLLYVAMHCAHLGGSDRTASPITTGNLTPVTFLSSGTSRTGLNRVAGFGFGLLILPPITRLTGI